MKKNILLAAILLLSLGILSCNRNDDAADQWVDLGLPSGLLWANCNIGSTAPEDYGNYYAWGEIQSKKKYDWSTYRYCTVDANDSLATLSKYNTSESFGAVDNKTVLEASDDVATAVLGSSAHIPTREDWLELNNNTDVVWTTVNGVSGRRFTSRSNGKSVFLPAAGGFVGDEIRHLGEVGCYWSSSLYNVPDSARAAYFGSDNQNLDDYGVRFYGLPVRAVRVGEK